MKIFIVCNYIGGGGAERVAVLMANGLAERGHEVSIIADLKRYRSYEVSADVRQLWLHKTGIPVKNRIWQGIKNIRKYAKQYKPDVIIGNMHICSLVSRLGTLGMGIPVILTIHHALESDTYHFPLVLKLLDRYSLWMYPYFTVLTQPDKMCLGRKGKRAIVMPNPVSFEPLTVVPHKDKIILASGRINDWRYKGWDILIKTWGKIADRYPDWTVKIAGNGSDEVFAYLKDLAKEHGVLDRIEFLGFRKDMMDLFNKASIFLLSSRTEGLPMVLIEAMSQGCAPVATDFKGRTKEIITNDAEGLLAVPEDCDKLAENLSLLIENPELREKVQKGAMERSKYYYVDHVIDLWEDFLRKEVVKV